MMERTDEMTLAAFETALDRWGGTLAEWPAPERQAAERLLSRDAAARQRHLAARQVDGALATLMQADASPFAVAPVRRARPAPAPSYRRLATWGSVALAASLAIGFAAGVALPDTSDDDAAGQVFAAVHDVDSGDYL